MSLYDTKLMLGDKPVDALMLGGRHLYSAPSRRIASIADSFDTFDGAKWRNTGSASVSGGRLHLDTNTNWDGGVESVKAYDLNETTVSIEVIQAPGNNGGDADCWFSFSNLNEVFTHDNNLNLDFENGNVDCSYYLHGNLVQIASIPYDPAVHRWVRYRITGGVVHWEYATNGIDWTEICNWTPPWDLGSMYVLLGCGWSFGDPPLEAIFDNFNLAPIVVDRDDFGGDLSGWDSQNAWNIVNGQAQLPFVDTTQFYADIMRYPTWIGDFTNKSCIVEIASASDQVNSPAEVYCGMVARSTNDHQVFFDIYGNEIHCTVWDLVNGNNEGSDAAYPYDPVAHRWLRVRHTGGQFHFDVSPNGGAWTELHSAPVPFDITNMFFDLGGGYYQTAVSVPPPIIVDNFYLVQNEPPLP